MAGTLRLSNGSQIAIIGGGPAGAFFAHFAMKYAQELGIDLSITLFDGKDFLQKGPKGCNLCAGVIAESLNHKLKKEGICLPEKRIINRVEGYSLHWGQEILHLSFDEYGRDTIATVFRGNGPRYSTFPDIISFDDFLLSWAQDRGAQIIASPVWDIKKSKDKNEPISVYYGKNNNQDKYEADLVIVACGVNTNLIKKIQGLGFGYKPPSTILTYQAEVKMGRDEVQRHFGNTIHVYMPKATHLRYVTIIPKGDFITITLIGKQSVNEEVFSELSLITNLQAIVPLLKPSCFCYPRIAVSPAKKPFTDRMVIIGDASFSRHYKNGIESAFLTAKLAAETACFKGSDASSFSSFYYKNAKKLIIHDNYYGRLLFTLNDVIFSLPPLAQIHFTLAKKERKNSPSKKIRTILWYMFTGGISYKDIFKISLDLKLQISLLSHTMIILIEKLKKSIHKTANEHKDIDPPRPYKE